jgi:hypothetical protein
MLHRPLNLYGLVSSLYQFEPSNFALVALLRSGELHRLTRNFEAKPEETVRQLLIVLANLFARQPRRAQNSDAVELSTRNSSSTVILPHPSNRIIQVLEQHNNAVTAIFSRYAKDYAQQHSQDLGEDATLSLSHRTVDASKAQADGAFAANLRQSKLSIASRSPFVALSGHDDHFHSVDELAETLRTDVVLTTHAVPVVPWIVSRDHQLDAYVLDFFKHGSLEVVIRDNGIPRGEIWFDLQHFDHAMLAIKAGIEALLLKTNVELDDDNDSDAGDDLDLDEKGGEDQVARPPNVSDGTSRPPVNLLYCSLI